MTYKPKLELPYKPTPPSKTTHICHEVHFSYGNLNDLLKELSEKSNLEFDPSDYNDIIISSYESATLCYAKTIPNENYEKQMNNYQKYLKQYERDLRKYNEMIKMIENFKQEK